MIDLCHDMETWTPKIHPRTIDLSIKRNIHLMSKLCVSYQQIQNICSFFSCTKSRSVDANVNFSDNKNMFDDKKDIYFPIKVSVERGKSNSDKETIMSPLSCFQLRFVRACACLLDFCFPLLLRRSMPKYIITQIQLFVLFSELNF
jgi:hypothetical protein